MLITLGPNVSYKIGKNPASPAKISKIRQGYGIGWFHETDYCIRFIDAPDEISYPDYVDQQYEYLAESKYNSPLCALNLLSEYCKTTEHDSVDLHCLKCYHVRVKDRTLKTIEKYFPQVKLEKLKYWNNYVLTIEQKSLVSELIALAEIVFLLITIDNDENIYIDDSLIEKAVKKLKLIDAPYYVRYMFKCILVGKHKFDKFKDDLSYSKHKLELCPYSNLDARIEFVKKNVSRSVVDVGCGEGRYITALANRVPNYYAIDISEDALFKAKKRCENKGIENVEFYNSLDLFLENQPEEEFDVVCSEVIEHLKYEDCRPFLDKILSIKGAKRVVITTPNKDFNKYYGIESRHEEHQFEADLNELTTLLSSLPYKWEYVGDVVNGIGTTFGVVIDV